MMQYFVDFVVIMSSNSYYNYLMQSSEQKFIQRIQLGDREAQKMLYDTYARRLMAISMRYLGSRECAEDNLHDAFIKILKSFKNFRYRGDGSLKAWMDRITINTALEHLRVQKRLVQLDESAISNDLIDEESVSNIGIIPQETLLKFVSELPDGYRTVFNLFCIEGFSHKQIAQQLGINEKSSSSQLLRAKRLLSTRIKTYIQR